MKSGPIDAPAVNGEPRRARCEGHLCCERAREVAAAVSTSTEAARRGRPPVVTHLEGRERRRPLADRRSEGAVMSGDGHVRPVLGKAHPAERDVPPRNVHVDGAWDEPRRCEAHRASVWRGSHPAEPDVGSSPFGRHLDAVGYDRVCGRALEDVRCDEGSGDTIERAEERPIRLALEHLALGQSVQVALWSTSSVTTCSRSTRAARSARRSQVSCNRAGGRRPGIPEPAGPPPPDRGRRRR